MGKRRIIVGVSGASGSALALALMRDLKARSEVETHLIVTASARRTWELEMAEPLETLLSLADHVHDETNMAASISSGSFRTDGMVVVPCSMRTLASIATGIAGNLLVRAADVCLKERRPVVLVPREMPLGRIHLKNMLAADELGCVMVPPMLTFYNGPTTLDDEMRHVVGKALMQLGFEPSRFDAWEGAE